MDTQTKVRSVTAHTPGPWSVSRELNQDRTRRFIWNDEYGVNHPDSPHQDTGFCVATIQPRGDCEALEANARLIAAAPELLAAVQAAIEFSAQPCTEGEVDVCRLDALHRLCVAAKRKAQGRS